MLEWWMFSLHSGLELNVWPQFLQEKEVFTFVPDSSDFFSTINISTRTIVWLTNYIIFAMDSLTDENRSNCQYSLVWDADN